MTTLQDALKVFEAVDANLTKLETLWGQIRSLIPNGAVFGAPPEYDEACFAFRRILPSVPAIDGFRIEDCLLEFDDIGQMRVDEIDVGDIEIVVANDKAIEEPGRQLRQYRLSLDAKRRELVRERVLELSDQIDSILQGIGEISDFTDIQPGMVDSTLPRIKERVDEIDALLGGDPRPSRWNDIRRHLAFSAPVDLYDIVVHDWPTIKGGLVTSLYGPTEPIPVETLDLADIVRAKPSGKVATALKWEVLTDEDFERLMFLLLSDADGYENPQWLQRTNAPDRGRDLSVVRVENDPLGGTRRYRMIVQCKHWLKRSVGPADIGAARDQMELWQAPRVDELVFATTGRFTADAVALVERHNQEDRALHIQMWPESHLERLLASRPHLIGQFRLR